MPRKGNYGVDYDDYEDYGYDYEFDVEESVAEIPQTKQDTNGTRVWRCSICTFDNEDSMSACDICGVLRNPLIKSYSNNNKNTADGLCRVPEASVMAKSLFASLACWTSKEAVTCQRQNDDCSTEECNNFNNLIAPFKFDVPSPDDSVSNGMHASKMSSKANFNKLSSSDVPSGIRKKNVAVELQSNARSDYNPASMSESRNDNKGEANFSSVDSHEPQRLSSSLNNISLNVKPGSSKNINTGRAKSHVEYKPEKWMLRNQAEDKTQLNLAIVGHVDSGKSTLSGRLLHLLGRISQKEMHKYEKEAKLQGKGSFAYAWALDEGAEERERGITMTVAVAYFESKKYHVVVLDSPGHKDFVPNMISGATQADAAILLIDASVGSFEAGMDSGGGQTREHGQLVRSFGVDHIIVAINKMDAVEYSKERFNIIKLQVGAFLRSCGFKDSSVSWIPLSAVENQNLVAASSDVRLLSWYSGPCLLDAIDSLQPPARDYSKPLVMPICDVIKSQPLGQVSACGKLEAGALRSGFKVLVLPSGDTGMVRSLERDSRACNIARAGDNVAVSLQGIDVSRVMAGGVLCHPDFPVAVANHLELKILVLDIDTPIVIGSQLEFHIHHAKEAARVVRILSLLDPKTGKVTKKAPRCLLAKQSAVIEVVLQSAVCVEEFSNCRALGRAFLRSLGKTVCVGVVTRTIEDSE